MMVGFDLKSHTNIWKTYYIWGRPFPTRKLPQDM